MAVTMGEYLFRNLRWWWIALGLVVGSAVFTQLHGKDLDKNYIRTRGLVSRVESHCFVVGKGLWGLLPSHEIACSEAMHTHETKLKRVLYETTVEFEFVSPQDRVRYVGKTVVDDEPNRLPQAGGPVVVFVHKEKPAKFEYGGPWQDTARKD